MKWTLKFEGDYHEEREELRQLGQLDYFITANKNAREAIRSRLKHQTMPAEEWRFLKELQEILYIPE